jgi:hypothetical protein
MNMMRVNFGWKLNMAALLLFVVPVFAIGASRFPTVKSVFETDEMLSNYHSYLSFVCEVGKNVDSRNTRKLLKIYSTLRRRNADQAALFLKGLRFEMISKVDLMGVEVSSLSTQTPELRRWVGRYMKEWVREADEHLFRTFSDAQLAKAE